MRSAVLTTMKWHGRMLGVAALFLATTTVQGMPAQSISLRLGPPVSIGAGHDLTYISQAVLGPRGLLAVGQPRDHTVLLFDLAKPSRPIATAGRRGDGPGEFASLNQIGWIGSQLWVTDGSRPRAEIFNQLGRMVRSRGFDRPASSARHARFFGPTAILRDSVALFFPSATAGPVALPPGAAGAVVPILLHHPRSDRYDTLAQIRPVRRLLVLVGDRGASVSSQPLLGEDIVRTGVDGQRILLVLQSSPTIPEGRVRIELRSATGDLVFESDLGVRGKELPSREWDALLARYVASNTEDIWSTSALATAGLRTALHRPRYLPVIADALLGQDGTIWLRKHGRHGENAEWMVLSPAGTIRGTIGLPPTMRVLDVTADRIVGALRDADDVETLFWARVEEQ